MRRPENRNSQQGLLLVEAVLSAIVIAAGLVFISRGLASQLKALRSIEDYETLVSLANNKLAELEAEAVTASPVLQKRSEGEFPDPYRGYRWKVTAKLQDDQTEHPPREVTVRVWRGTSAATGITLSTLWPGDWVPPTWSS